MWLKLGLLNNHFNKNFMKKGVKMGKHHYKDNAEAELEKLVIPL